MRLTSLLILAAIVLGLGYVVIFKWDWVKGIFKSGTELAEGYKAAETPQQAMDFFTKAIKARKYDTAGKYVQGNYKEQLERAHAAASEMGGMIDKIMDYAQRKGFNSDSAMAMLLRLDPFPPHFSVAGEPLKDKKDATKAYGLCKWEWTYGPPTARDAHTFATVTLPANPLAVPVLFKGAPLVEVDADGSKVWKLHIEIAPIQVNAITEYMNKYKSYYSALENFHRDVLNNRHDTKEEFRTRLLAVVTDSK